MNQETTEFIAKMKDYGLCFIKFISSNDSGETGAHQEGIYIPKNAIPILFESPGIKGENKEKFVDIAWSTGEITRSRFIYYGKGTRNEYRITRLGVPLKKDSLFILLKNNEEYGAHIFAKEDTETFLDYFSLERSDTNQIFETEFLFENIKPNPLPEKEKVKVGEGIYHIRPAGRHILTIGRDLIKDNYAAIVELVKNSYDADAHNVEILFTTKIFDKKKHVRIKVSDDGHGMNYDTVVNKWMVPSTDDKLRRKYSPSGRLMQGRKGIGRYATAILGSEVFMETNDISNENTTVYINWNEFENHKYLDDVPILIEKFTASEDSKTVLEITGSTEMLESWTKESIDSLVVELKKLKDPRIKENDDDKFNIILKFSNFPIDNYDNLTLSIEPFPLLDLFDYRISGTIDANGIADLTYENKSAIGILPERYEFPIKFGKNESSCGKVNVDLRVYDREPEAIQNLIDRGLNDPITGQSLGRLDARRILNENSGVGIYRGNFRIRPYGDSGFDWLLLDKERVQNPSLRIGSNQIIGFVEIKSEEESGLEEKSARDGLKEDNAYFGLRKIVLNAINKLEQNRFQFRTKTGKGRKGQTVNDMVQTLFNLSDLRADIEEEINKAQVPAEIKDRVNEFIAKKEQDNIALSEAIIKKIAEYEGHVTLGKIVNIILHEGRKPFMYYANHIPLIKAQAKILKEQYSQDVLESIIGKIDDIRFQSQILSDLFNKIDPLAAKRRDSKEKFRVIDVLNTTRKVFEKELERQSINLRIECNDSVVFEGWKSDFYITFTNLIENSIYWFSESEIDEKIIEITAQSNGNGLRIDFFDNGIGIDPKFIEDSTIFEPGFSTRTEGTGLGLAIAGEAMARNDCKLKVEDVETGVHFIIEKIIQSNG